MAGHLRRAEHPHHQADRAERARFQELLQPHRDAELQETKQRRDETRLPPGWYQMRPQRRPGEDRVNAIAINQRLASVASALPDAPRAGLPRCPYTKTQLSPALQRFAPTIVHTIGATRCSACSAWRKTTNTRNGRTPGIEIIDDMPSCRE